MCTVFKYFQEWAYNFINGLNEQELFNFTQSLNSSSDIFQYANGTEIIFNSLYSEE